MGPRPSALTRRCGWRTVYAVALAVLLSPVVVSAFDFYPPFLPDHIAANETTTPVELRLYLTASDANTTTQVRLTPVSNAIQFTPSDVVFTSTSPVAHMLTMVAHKVGTQTITFVAQVETLQNGNWVVSQSANEISSHQIEVLAPPPAYAIDDPRWRGVILRNDSFDSDGFTVATSSLWGSISHGYPSAACGASDGTKALYFTALGDRSATTKPLSLLGFDGKLHFQQLYGYRSGQDYDGTGDNRISCETVDKGEEMVLSFLPAGDVETNASAWHALLEAPVPDGNTGTFTPYSVVLPIAAMHSHARFRWQQKTHSSFPVDPVSGLSLAAVTAGENDNSSVKGDLGMAERELWTFRNLFDQWALDDVRLEVRLTPPTFENVEDLTTQGLRVHTSSGDVTVSIGHATILVHSPVDNTWTEFASGDGTHAYPTCDLANAVNANTRQTVRINQSGYIHAVACLVIDPTTSAMVSSFPTRSERVLVQANAPTITTTVDTTTPVDTWTVRLACDGCSFMRYTASSPFGGAPDQTARLAPSCSFGIQVDGSSGSFRVTANSQIVAVACGEALLASAVASTALLTVAPRIPSVTFTYTPTTITNDFQVTISPAAEATLGIAYTVGEGTSDTPVCPSPEAVVAGHIVLTVRAFNVIRAVACCVGVSCADSTAAVWGPIDVQAVAPVSSMACSRTTPQTVVLHLASVTTDAWVQYHIGPPSTPLDCTATDKAPFLYHGESIKVADHSTSVVAVSCLHGLQPSDPIEIPVFVDHCCAGIEAYLRPSCAHVLLLHDDFETCLDASKWTRRTTQWGGQGVNGGVHADNVACVHDVTRAKNVLRLSAHGDLFAGTSPVGNKRIDSDEALQARTVDDMYLEWALDGVSPTPCNELDRCPARRVGAAIQTASLLANAGVMVIRVRPCQHFGTLTQIWWGEYTSRDDETLQQAAFLPLWKAGLYQAKTTSQVSYVLSSPSSLPLDDGAWGGGGGGDQEEGFIELAMQWDASIGRSNLYVNGQLVHQQVLSSNASFQSLANEALSIGVWFPNAVAGEPLFATCDVVVDQVHVFKPEITSNRWCDVEAVTQDTVSCTTDRDCHDWVDENCFMPIYEAVCIAHRNETLKAPPSFPPVEEEEGDDTGTMLEVDVGDSESADSASAVLLSYCQFRLQPTTAQADVTETFFSTTEMTRRAVGLQWLTEEGSLTEAVALQNDDEYDTK